MDPSFNHVVVIGASTGGVGALLEITSALPPSFPAPICVVQHVGAHPSLLPELLRYRRPNNAVHAQDGQRIAAGTLYIAPPDRHLLLEGDRLRVVHGAKENHARPAIDPLFRSAALSWGPNLIGVVLTGQLDDGSAGLAAVKDCGGIAVVQDPAEAVEPEMPYSALAACEVDHCVPLAHIAPLLARLVRARPQPLPPAPERLAREVAINRDAATLDNLAAITIPSCLTCPDCGGTLSEVKEGKPLRYRCHTGHAFSVRTLISLQADAADSALWGSIRILREREMLLRRSAGVARGLGDQSQWTAGEAQADSLREQIRALEAIARGSVPGGQRPA
ncbi:MAG: Protein-glutamate methylesterase [Ramlibacter sp.]|jgi:two-component system chemotaxis response regulator CheB|uniref:chemotaxis protein CheB n=1 Tax=Ramlibacter sp. TaxID=1917967 RepID=UPI002604485C|nr:chemotaxis protein CheB [Ramlibacter sp.]MDB5751410.1 Protein-glutamate methylesterase [Ramlibacter sp.]